MVVLGFTSIGNTMNSSFLAPLVGATLSAYFLVIILTSFIGLQLQDKLIFLEIVMIFFATVAIICHLQHFVKIVIPKSYLEKHPSLAFALRQGGISNEMMVKQSASLKINNMVINALKVSKAAEGADNVMDTYFGQNLMAFSKVATETKLFGGYGWVVRNIWNGDLFRKEGIWISAKILANMLTMAIISIYLLWEAIGFTITTMKSLNDGEFEAGLDLFIQDTIDQIAAYVLNVTLSSQDMTGITTDVSDNIANVLLQNVQNSGIDCTTALNNTQVVLDSTCLESFNCSLLNENFLCSLSNIGGSTSDGSTLEMLEAAGFNFTEISESVSQTLSVQVKVAIYNYFPDNIYTM